MFHVSSGASSSIPVSSLIPFSLHPDRSHPDDEVRTSAVSIAIAVLQQLICINICSCYQLFPSHHAPQSCFPFLLACCLITRTFCFCCYRNCCLFFFYTQYLCLDGNESDCIYFTDDFLFLFFLLDAETRVYEL